MPLEFTQNTRLIFPRATTPTKSGETESIQGPRGAWELTGGKVGSLGRVWVYRLRNDLLQEMA